MFRSTGIFNELMCPDSHCTRPYCSFWHNPAPVAGPSQAPPPLIQADAPPEVPLHADLYNPYSQEYPSFSGYSASVAQPSNIPTYSVGSTYNGYIASEENNESSHSIQPHTAKPTKEVANSNKETINHTIMQSHAITIKTEPIDVENNSAQNIFDEEEAPIQKSEISGNTPVPKKALTTPQNPGNLLECAKSISEIDAEIERLKKLREQHKQKAAVLRGPINIREEPKTKKERPIIEYVPKKIKSEKPSTVAYIPTPIAELERKKAEKRKAEVEKTEIVCKEERVEIELAQVCRVSSTEEDLFGEDVPLPSKKARVSDAGTSRSNSAELIAIAESRRRTSMDDSKSSRLTEAQIAAAKLRVARPAAGIRSLPTTNRKMASAVQQMHARMEAIAKEKKVADLKESSSTKKPQTLEQKFGEKRSTVKDGRVSKTAQAPSSSKPVLIEPSSTKVPMNVRLQNLTRIYSEFLNFLPSKDAKAQAEIEEKSVLDKVKHKQGYVVAVVNALKKIRDIGEGKTTAAGNTKISHEQVLLGKAYGKCTLNANGPKKAIQITEDKVYPVLEENYLLTEEQLRANSYPVWESENKVHIEPSFYDKKRCKKTFVADFDMTRVCVRCTKEFQLNMKGKIVRDSCVYHLKSKSRMPGKIRNNEARYPCCGGDDTMEGCQIGIAHVCDTLRESELLKFVSTPPPTGDGDTRSRKIFALDCEMVYTVWGPALARITVVDFDGKVALDEIIKPEYMVIDYNTTFSGITAAHLETATHNLDTALLKLFKLVNSETILIGHSLESDLKAMRVVHSRVVDTSVLFPHRIDDQKKRGLRELCLDKLGKSIQDDIDGHDSKEDSVAALELVIYKVKYDGKLK